MIAYPVAYVIARHGGRYKNALVALLVVPFFANYLVRMYGWQTLLSDEGVIMTRLRALGAPADFHILDTPGAVIGGLVYGYIVFMILPVYASLERMDGSVIEAGRDLYGSPLGTFLTVTVPATRAGAYAGTALVFLPAMGDFISAQPARRPGRPHDRQPDPGQVLRRPELAARGRADDGADAPAADLPVRLRAPDRTRLEGGGPMTAELREPTRTETAVVPAATAARQRRRRGSGMDRKPKVAVAVTVLFFVLLYLPIVAVVVFSFNEKKSLTVFDGWSLKWYRRVPQRQRAHPVARDQPPGGRGRDGRVGGHRHRCWRSVWCAPGPGSAARRT